MGKSWAQWEAATNYWPKWSAIARAGTIPWLAALGLRLGLGLGRWID